jgi:aryl-alcohol dehydrogenase-like predicted oxidoreductase
MRYVEANGARVSSIGLGCWQFGSSDWGYGKEYGDTIAVPLVHYALDHGVNLIDTAEIYAKGVSEAIVGRALEGRRDEAFLATKVVPTWPTASRVEEHGRLSSMRIGVETIDLYQQHWPNPAVPIASTMEGMRRLQESGIVKHVGVSNFGVGRWTAAERALGSPVLSNQVRFNLLQRKHDEGNVPYAQANDRIVIAYSPLGMGLLSGRYDSANPPTGSARLNNPLFLPENLDRARPLIEAVRAVANAHGATPAQVSLAWLIRKPNVVAIPGASSVDQLRHNIEAADLDLTDDEVAELTAASDRFTPLNPPKTVAARFRARRTAA